MAQVLPRVQIDLELFAVPQMECAVVELYSSIIQHFHHIALWYEGSRFSHVVKALTQPWSLAFKDVVDRIEECSRGVEKLAMSLSRQEVRQVHQLLEQVRSKQHTAEAQHLDARKLVIALHAEAESKCRKTSISKA